MPHSPPRRASMASPPPGQTPLPPPPVRGVSMSPPPLDRVSMPPSPPRRMSMPPSPPRRVSMSPSPRRVSVSPSATPLMPSVVQTVAKKLPLSATDTNMTDFRSTNGKRKADDAGSENPDPKRHLAVGPTPSSSRTKATHDHHKLNSGPVVASPKSSSANPPRPSAARP